MGTPAIGAAFNSSSLAIVLYRPERIQVVDFYEENPVGIYRGLAFAMIFNFMLAMTGYGGWMVWKMLR